MDYNLFLRHLRGPTLTRIIIFLSIMGPGIITASVDNDAGGITTYSLAGSQFGYVLLWTFIPITIALAIIQEMLSLIHISEPTRQAEISYAVFCLKKKKKKKRS